MVLTKIEVKIWKFKVPAFFQFSRLFTVFPPFFNFPAFFGSSYHDVNNWRNEFNFATTTHHAGVKVCTCMFSNITKSMMNTRKSHLERFFPNECARILTTCRERARTTCRERLNEWSMRRVSQKHTIGSGKGSFPNFLENTLDVHAIDELKSKNIPATDDSSKYDYKSDETTGDYSKFCALFEIY